jgi:hypothetical protein
VTSGLDGDLSRCGGVDICGGVSRDPEIMPVPGRSLTALSFMSMTAADAAALARTIDITRPDVVVLPEAGEHYGGC